MAGACKGNSEYANWKNFCALGEKERLESSVLSGSDTGLANVSELNIFISLHRKFLICNRSQAQYDNRLKPLQIVARQNTRRVRFFPATADSNF